MRDKIDIEHVENKLKEHITFNRDPHSFLHVEWIYLRNSLDEIIRLRKENDILIEGMHKILDPMTMSTLEVAKQTLIKIKA